MYQSDQKINQYRVSNTLNHMITDIIEIKMTINMPCEELIVESLQ